MNTATINTGRVIRWMIRRDLPDILRIENESFDFPWREDDFIRCLRQRNCIGVVSEDRRGIESFSDRPGPIDGYMIYELQRNHLHVLSFAVRFGVRRQGVGTAMVDRLKGKLCATRRTRIMLEVRESNYYAQAFFRSQGFRAIEVMRDFYLDTDEDAYRFQYRLPGVVNTLSDAACGGK